MLNNELASVWGLDKALSLPRLTIHTAHELEINILNYAWKRRQLTSFAEGRLRRAVVRLSVVGSKEKAPTNIRLMSNGLRQWWVRQYFDYPYLSSEVGNEQTVADTQKS